MFGMRNVFPYFLCDNCGCLQIESVPSNIAHYYPEEYYSLAPPAAQTVRRTLRRFRDGSYTQGRSLLGRTLAALAPSPELYAVQRLSIKPDAAICDVGCGSGALLRRMRDIGFRSLFGIDPFLKEESREQGFEIHRLSLDQLDGRFDLIMFHHSFEHMPEPRQALGRVRQLLKPTGRCLVRVPTVSSWAWEHYRENWVQLDAPRHFFLHSARSLSILAGLVGMELIDLWYDSTSFQFMSELYAARIPLRDSRGNGSQGTIRAVVQIPKALVRRLRAQRLNRAGRGDSLAVVLRPTLA